MEVLSLYLAGSPISIFQHELVEIPDPYSTEVSFSKEERPNSSINIHLSNVPTKKLEEAEKKVFEILQETVDKPLNYEYLQDCLQKRRREELHSMEVSMNHFTMPVIYDFLFSNRDGSGLDKMKSLIGYQELEKWSENDWKQFIKRYEKRSS